MIAHGKRILAISGGVGGAKLALGLSHIVAPDQLDVLVNTADDFRHLGLRISPDIDTLLYTLSGRSNKELGWGLEGESWRVMDALDELGGDTWFRLGDRDLATHLWRTAELESGEGLADVTRRLAQQLGVRCGVHPMSDDPVGTVVQSSEGELPFQDYFVRRQCEPTVSGFHFEGMDRANPNSTVLAMLERGEVAGVVICPSNPFVSVDPILKMQGMTQAIQDAGIPVIAVSPIVAGMALKGPAAKMMRELEMPVNALAVAEHYARQYPGLLDCFVIDESDGTLASQIEQAGFTVAITPTIMKTLKDKEQLAQFTLRQMGL